MSKKANKTLIGAFVIGAIALIVAGVVIFGSGKLFTSLSKFVMVFDGSVKGLNVGSPVIFRGVKIGEVTGLQLRLNTQDLTAVIPVYVEIDTRTLHVSEEGQAIMRKRALLKPLIAKGLKGQLQMQSFVTGQLMINLDFYPDKPIKLTGIEKKYLEIPTVEAPMDELAKTIENLPLKEIFAKVDHAMDGINKMVNAPGAHNALGSFNDTMLQTKESLNDYSDLRFELSSMLRELSAATRSIHYLSDYLERHPDALLRGKASPKGE